MKNDLLRGNFRAFTLAELLMAVLVISIIMVALAPVITRRAYDNVSIEVNQKKGLEIFTNPGTYTFDVPVGINTLFLQGSAGGGGGAGATYIDKAVSFTSNTTWTVPKGVPQLTFTITGSGGGGGAGNGASMGQSCRADEMTAIRGSSDEMDLCWMKYNRDTRPSSGQVGSFWNAGTLIESPYTTACTSENCGWVWDDRVLYTKSGASNVCSSYTSDTYGIRKGYRLPNINELKKVQKYFDDWVRTGILGLCVQNSCARFPQVECRLEPTSSKVKQCNALGLCHGASNDWCAAHIVQGSDSHLRWDAYVPGSTPEVFSYQSTFGTSVRCVKEIKKYSTYSGAGGNSGAKLEKTINVLPGDTLTLTIGAGGTGGTYNTSRNNGIGSRSGNGAQGANTQIIHKRGGVELGTYYVKGGFGGWAATTSAHGTSVTNGSSSGQSTPSGMCYAKNRRNTTDSFSGGNVSCNVLSYSGSSGSSTSGGSGGRVSNSGSATSGGVIYVDPNRTASQRNTQAEADKAKGVNATTNGFGGGGGLTPAWAVSSSNFYQGGSGKSGKIDISYRIMLPGAGGGSASRVGGSKLISGNDTLYEIKYKVTEGSRLVFKIGSGGSGGAVGQNGLNGEATVVGDDEIVFLGGQGGFSVTQSQKNNLSNCIGTTTSSSVVLNCLNNTSYKPTVGTTSVIDQNSNIKSTTLGLIIKNSSNVGYTLTPPSNTFKGSNGKTSVMVNSTTVPWSYGFDGGIGGSPFGIRSNNIAASITCSGGMSATYGTTTNANSYVCTSGSIDGNNARNHDPVNNEYGGSGGGGGGVIADSLNLGQGGSGSSGYLRIRWDETENEEW